MIHTSKDSFPEGNVCRYDCMQGASLSLSLIVCSLLVPSAIPLVAGIPPRSMAIQAAIWVPSSWQAGRGNSNYSGVSKADFEITREEVL